MPQLRKTDNMSSMLSLYNLVNAPLRTQGKKNATMAITLADLKARNVANREPATVSGGKVVFIPEGDGVIPYFQPEGASFEFGSKFYPNGIPGQLITDLDTLDELLKLINVL